MTTDQLIEAFRNEIRAEVGVIRAEVAQARSEIGRRIDAMQSKNSEEHAAVMRRLRHLERNQRPGRIAMGMAVVFGVIVAGVFAALLGIGPGGT